jgi:hypothetical protein
VVHPSALPFFYGVTGSGFEALNQGILKGESIAVLLTSCLTGLDQPVLQIKKQKLSVGHKANSKPVT